jgi:hypothetical protein
MPESLLSHVMEKLNELPEHTAHTRSHAEAALELFEAVVLALVAVATAWSGYQAARCDGHRAQLYAESAKLRTEVEDLHTLAGQDRIYDIATFNSWIAAKVGGSQKLAALFENRFRDEYRSAFSAWLNTDPFNNPKALPGPVFMPEYRSARLEEAKRLNVEAATIFERGTEAEDMGNRYVRITVLLATVLLLISIGQRFQVTRVRTGLLITAFLLLSVPLWNLVSLWHKI